MPTLHTLHRRLDKALTQFKALDLGSKPGGCCPEPYDPKQPYYPTIYVSDRAEAEVLDVAEEGTAVIKYRVKGRSMSERNGKKRYGMDLEVRSFDPEAAEKADAKKKAEGEAVKLSARVKGQEVKGQGSFHEFAHTPVGKPWPAGTIGRVAWQRGAMGGAAPRALNPNVRKNVAAQIRQSRKDPMRQIIKANSPRMSRFSEFSDRTRNGDGQFVANVTGGADPVTMRQAYGEKKKSNLLLPGAAAGALAGAGLLAGTGKGRGLLASGLRKVEGLARTGRDKLQGRQRMSKPGRGRHREPGFGEVLMRDGKPEGRPKLPGAMTRYHAILDAALTEFGLGRIGAAIGGGRQAMKNKEGETTPEYLARTAKGTVKGALIGKGTEIGGAALGTGLLLGSRRARVLAHRVPGLKKAANATHMTMRKMRKMR